MRAGAPLDIARQAGIDVVTGATVLGTRGRLGVREVTIGVLSSGAVNDTRRIECDALLVSGGYTPSVHLFSQSRGKLEFDAARQAFLPSVSAEPESSAGSCRGVDGYAEVLNDGARVGAAVGAGGGAFGRGARNTACRPASSACTACRACCRRPTTCSRRARSSTSRTTSPPRTSRWPCAKGSNRSSTSSATRRPAWRRTRARPPT